MLSLRQELSTCSKWWTNLTSPNLDIGPWTLNCWMSLSMELAPCHSMESFCHAVTSQFGSANTRSTLALCHGTPRPPCPHAPDHLRSSLTSSTYTPVSLQCTLRKLAQPRHSCHQTKLGSMSNFPGLSPYVSDHCLFVFFSICHICLMHFHGC